MVPLHSMSAPFFLSIFLFLSLHSPHPGSLPAYTKILLDSKALRDDPRLSQMTLPACSETLPAGLETLPADSEAFPAGSEALPAGSETFPAGFEAIQAGSKPPPHLINPLITGSKPFSAGSTSIPTNLKALPPSFVTLIIYYGAAARSLLQYDFSRLTPNMRA